MRLRRNLLALFGGMAVGFASPTTATVRHVPSEYSTINEAMDAALAGDMVLVAPGVYDQYQTRVGPTGALESSVAFLRAGMTLASEGGSQLTTLRMDSTTGSPIVVQDYGAAGDFEVDGFTITGSVSGLDGMEFTFTGRCVVGNCVFSSIGSGGTSELAIGSVSADLHVYESRFENISGGSGSGIHQTSGTLLVEDSEFLNCRQGAMVLRWDPSFPHATDLTVRRCRFLGNESNLGNGGAISVVNYSNVLVETSWFDGNQSLGPSATGGAIIAAGLGQVIRGNTFANSSAGNGKGGAIRVIGPMLMEGNTFWGSHVGIDWSTGGAAVFFDGNNAVFRQNVVVNSTGDQAVGISGATLQTSCNVYWDNPLGNTSGFVPDATDLFADPMFCDVPAKDFHVNAASPCIPGNGHPSCTELIGAWDPACGVVSVEPCGWGRIKSGFRSGSEEMKR